MTAPQLHVLAPGLLGPVPEGLVGATRQLADLRALEIILARGRRIETGEMDAAGMLRRLAVSTVPPPGPLLATGLGCELGERYWYCATPCHLRADRDRVLLQSGPDTVPDADEARALAEAFNALYRNDGLELVAVDGRWVLAAAQPLSIDPPDATAVNGRYLDDFLPAGADGAPWRAFLNETQMLLHGHPVNERRESDGRTAINGVWFWGGGARPAPFRLSARRLLADEPLWHGAVTLAGGESGPGVERLSRVPTGEDALVQWDDAERALLEGDGGGWLSALADFERDWAREAESAIGNGTWQTVSFYFPPVAGVSISRGALRRFWRRRRPLAHYLDAQ